MYTELKAKKYRKVGFKPQIKPPTLENKKKRKKPLI